MFNSNKFWLNHKDSLFELQIPNNKDLLILVNKINQNKNNVIGQNLIHILKM